MSHLTRRTILAATATLAFGGIAAPPTTAQDATRADSPPDTGRF